MLLAIDTCFDACSVAVGEIVLDDVMIRAVERQPMAQGHAEALPRMVERALAAWGKTGRDVTRIAVTHGPGTFAGTRVGVAFARGLRLARQIPATGVSSLQALAVPVITALDVAVRRRTRIVVAMDARRGEIYAQIMGGDYRAQTDPFIGPVDGVCARIPPGATLVLGSGAHLLVESARAAGRTDVASAEGAEIVPHARAVAFLAARFAGGDDAQAPAPRPLYLRQADTTAPRAAANGRA